MQGMADEWDKSLKELVGKFDREIFGGNVQLTHSVHL